METEIQNTKHTYLTFLFLGHVMVFLIILILIGASVVLFRAHFNQPIYSNSELFRGSGNDNISWPEHWKLILSHSKALQLIMLDSAALKCLFSGYDKSRGCNSLYSNSVIRFGTLITDFPKLLNVVDSVVRVSAQIPCL